MSIVLPILVEVWQQATQSSTARMIQLLALTLLLILVSTCICDTNKNSLLRLHDDLFANGRIDPKVMPSTQDSGGGPLKVAYNIYLMNTLKLDELQGRSTINLWVQYEWIEPKLKWNPAEYNNVTIIRSPSDRVWKPLLTHYGSANFKEIYPQGNPMVLVFNTGRVTWVPPTTFSIICEMDYQWFPYDEHTCRLSVISWTHSTKEINIMNAQYSAMEGVDYVIKNPVWDLTYFATSTLGMKNSIIKNLKDVDFPFISYELRFRRRPTYYQNMIISSAVMAAALMLTVFCIPSHHMSRRFSISTCSFLILFLLILQLSVLVPFGGKNSPKIYYMCNGLLIMAAITFPLSAILNLVANGSNTILVPTLISKISETRFNQQIDVLEDVPGGPSIEWRLAASALDRIFIILYVTAFIVLLISCHN